MCQNRAKPRLVRAVVSGVPTQSKELLSDCNGGSPRTRETTAVAMLISCPPRLLLRREFTLVERALCCAPLCASSLGMLHEQWMGKGNSHRVHIGRSYPDIRGRRNFLSVGRVATGTAAGNFENARRIYTFTFKV